MSDKDKINKHIISKEDDVRTALKRLDFLGPDAILFVTEPGNKLIGSLTDGDLRRGFIAGLSFDHSILEFIQENFYSITEKSNSIELLEEYKKKNLKIIPVLNDNGAIVDIINFRNQRSVILADAILMAGGEGKRLRPLTQTVPKPLLKVGNKPIIEHNIDNLISVGIKKITLSINYLGEQLEEYFNDGSSKNIKIDYIKENKPMGTIGSVTLISNFENSDIIVMNSDLLTTIDFVDFYKTYKQSNADMAIATTNYQVDIPYAVLETKDNNKIISIKEKPRYNYFSNAGIYLIKKELFSLIPTGDFFDITDLIEKVIGLSYEIIAYPINGYWLDIGKHDDYKKAQEDIKHLKLG